MIFMLATVEFNRHSKFFGLCSLAGRRVRSLFHVNFIPIYAEVGLLFFVWRFFRRQRGELWKRPMAWSLLT